jgi:hypothetical protein
MGQQLPFETLNAVTTGLGAAEAHYQPGRKAETTVGVVRLEPSSVRLPRVELSLTTPAGDARTVHLYETYWAPLTEGKIRDRDVVGFLLAAGWNGVRRGVGTFRRIMFGREQVFRESNGAATLLSFLAAFAVFLSLIVIQAIVAAVAGARAVLGATSGTVLGGASADGPGRSSGWPSDALMGDLSLDLLLFALPVLLILFATQMPARMRRRAKVRAFWDPWRLNGPFRRFCWGLAYAALVGTVAVAGLMVLHLALHQSGGAAEAAEAAPVAAVMWWERWIGFNWQWIQVPAAGLGPSWAKIVDAGLLVLVWGGAYLAGDKARWFFRQYLGDVAIYITPHTLDRFLEARQSIKDCAARIGHAIYEATAADGKSPLYERVVVVAHSLGSVVAYDMLNELIKDDAVRGHPVRVAARTPLFLTFGAPLDKVAYAFGTRRPNVELVEHSLAAVVQPMIMGYDDKHRPARWINIHSDNDWISGDLQYFDTAKEDATPQEFMGKRVKNWPDPEATTPLQAHNEYWDGQLLLNALYGVLTDRPSFLLEPAEMSSTAPTRGLSGAEPMGARRGDQIVEPTPRERAAV